MLVGNHLATTGLRAILPTHSQDSFFNHVYGDASVDICDHVPPAYESMRQRGEDIDSSDRPL